MALAAGAGVLRWTVAAITTSLGLLACIPPLHGPTFALFHLAAIRLIVAAAPVHLAATAQALCCAVSPTEQQHENGCNNLTEHHAAAEFIRGATDRSKSPERKAGIAPAANGQQGSATHHAGEPVALRRSVCVPVPDERLSRSLVQGAARSHQNETAAALLS